MAPRQHHPVSAVRRAVTTTVALVVLVTSGCSLLPWEETDTASSNDGLLVELEDVRLSNVLVLTPARGQPGTVLGAIDNDSTEPVEVAIGLAGSDDVTTVNVGPGELVLLGPRDEPVPIAAVPARPGATVDLEISSATHGSTTVAVPVLDGRLARYDGLVPEPTNDARSTTGEAPLAPR